MHWLEPDVPGITILLPAWPTSRTDGIW